MRRAATYATGPTDGRYHRGALLPRLLVWSAIRSVVSNEPSPTIELEWDAPAECPDRAAVRAEIEALAIGERRSVVANAVVTRRTHESWHLDLEIETADGRQHFEWDAMACGSLARGAALAIGAAADAATIAVPPAPLLPTEAQPAEPQDEPLTVEATPAPPVVRDASPPGSGGSRGAAPRSRASMIHGWLRLHAAAGVAQLPGFDGRLGAGGGVGWRWLRAEAIAAVSLPRETRALDVDVGARMLAFDVAARVGASTSGRVAVGGLVGAEIGALRARGIDVQTPDTAYDLWIAATLGPTMSLAVGRRAAFFAGIDAVVALRRPRFAIREQADAAAGEIVFRPRRGGARVWIGFGVRLGR